MTFSKMRHAQKYGLYEHASFLIQIIHFFYAQNSINPPAESDMNLMWRAIALGALGDGCRSLIAPPPDVKIHACG